MVECEVEILSSKGTWKKKAEIFSSLDSKGTWNSEKVKTLKNLTDW